MSKIFNIMNFFVNRRDKSRERRYSRSNSRRTHKGFDNDNRNKSKNCFTEKKEQLNKQSFSSRELR